MPLSGIAAKVEKAQVHALLLARAPGILDDTGDAAQLFEQTVRGIATEVIPLVGSDPRSGARLDLGVWCITLGVAAQIEAALFPEQQGPGGRSEYLDRRYQAALAQLRDIPRDDQEEGQSPPVGSRASFPDATAYPDPVRVFPQGYL